MNDREKVREQILSGESTFKNGYGQTVKLLTRSYPPVFENDEYVIVGAVSQVENKKVPTQYRKKRGAFFNLYGMNKTGCNPGLFLIPN